MMDMFVERFARFWMPPGETDPISALRRRHKKADGQSLTQFNTGGLIIGAERTIVMSECQPYETLPNWLQLVPPGKSLDRIREEIAGGLETPAWLFFLKKGEVVVDAWLPSVGSQYVINFLDGPDRVIDRRNASLAKALFESGRGATYRDAAQLIKKRLNSADDSSTIDVRLRGHAKKLGIDAARFITFQQVPRPSPRLAPARLSQR